MKCENIWKILHLKSARKWRGIIHIFPWTFPYPSLHYRRVLEDDVKIEKTTFPTHLILNVLEEGRHNVGTGPAVEGNVIRPDQPSVLTEQSLAQPQVVLPLLLLQPHSLLLCWGQTHQLCGWLIKRTHRLRHVSLFYEINLNEAFWEKVKQSWIMFYQLSERRHQSVLWSQPGSSWWRQRRSSPCRCPPGWGRGSSSHSHHDPCNLYQSATFQWRWTGGPQHHVVVTYSDKIIGGRSP